MKQRSRTTPIGVIASVVLATTLSASCQYYRLNRWQDREPRWENTSTRSVPNGFQGQLVARAVGDDIVVEATKMPLCRKAFRGRKLDLQMKHEEKSLGPGHMLSFVLVLPLLVYMIMPYYRRTEVIAHDHGVIEVWDGERAPCGAPVPDVGRVFVAKSELQSGAQKLSWVDGRRTDANGRAVMPGFWSKVGRAAALCEMDASISVTGEYPEPKPPPGSDTPAAPFVDVLTPGARLFNQVRGPAQRSLAGITNPSNFEQLCVQRREQACLAAERPKFQLRCEEQCHTQANVQHCIFGQRKCLAQITAESERALCATLHRECVVTGRGVPETIDGCVVGCVSAEAKRGCGL